MIIFEQIWVLVLLPLPLIVRVLAFPYQTLKEALSYSRYDELVSATQSKTVFAKERSWLQSILLCFSWLCLILALAEPVLLSKPQVVSEPTRDMMIAVDLSGSMETRDYVDSDGAISNRLDGVRQVLHEFVENRSGDRLGLILFGSAAYLQTPFTPDRVLFSTLLNEAQVRMAGPKTMLGDAIGLAVKHFKSSEEDQKVLILLTDGNDSGSQVPPIDAATIANNDGIVIYTIAVGNPRAIGEEELDLATLQKISNLTSGQFYHANSAVKLQQISFELDKLEPSYSDQITYRPKQSLFYWPLALALLLQICVHLAIAIMAYIRSNQNVTVVKDKRSGRNHE